MKKISIDTEAFDNLLGMLNSTEEDAIVALTTISNIDIKSNICKLLLLRKLGECKMDLWEEYCKKLNSWITSKGLDPKKLSYQDIFNILLKNKVSSEDLQFFFDIFGVKLLKSIRSVGYEFLDNVEIKLNYSETR